MKKNTAIEAVIDQINKIEVQYTPPFSDPPEYSYMPYSGNPYAKFKDLSAYKDLLIDLSKQPMSIKKFREEVELLHALKTNMQKYKENKILNRFELELKNPIEYAITVSEEKLKIYEKMLKPKEVSMQREKAV